MSNNSFGVEADLTKPKKKKSKKSEAPAEDVKAEEPAPDPED